MRGCFTAMSFFLFGIFATVTPAYAQITTDYAGIASSLGNNDIISIVVDIVNVALSLMALVAVIFIIYGGYMWLTSAGNPDKVNKAKAVLRNAGIGLVIIMVSWGLVLWLIGFFSDATGGSIDDASGTSGGGYIPTSDSSFYVLSTDPESGETGASLCAVQVRMSKDIDTSTVTPDTWYLHIPGGVADGGECSSNNVCGSGLCQENRCVGDTVAGVIAFGPGDTTSTFNFVPDTDLEINTTYEAVIVGGTDGVFSYDDTPDDGIDDRLALTSSYIWQFTTGSEKDETPPTVQVHSNSPFPADGEAEVCTNTVINFDFSEPMLTSTFNDDQSFVLDSAGTPDVPFAPDWADPLALKGWSFGGDFDYAQVRPETTLNSFSYYSTRLYGGDASNDFAGALTDYCGNALDGDGDGIAEGSTVDNFYGFDEAAGATEDPITWETGDNASCTPVIESVNPGGDYYGDYAGLHSGQSCTTNTECGSGSCEAGVCVEYGQGTLAISGLYLAPHAEVIFQDGNIYAAETVNTCFNTDHYGNMQDNTSAGDICMDEADQRSDQLSLRTPVGTNDSTLRVSVAGEESDPSSSEVDVYSPYIQSVDPSDGAVGQYITMSGDNYGDTPGTVIMRSLDGTRTSTMAQPTACGNVWTNDEIVAIAPETYTDATGEHQWVTGDVGYIQVIHADGHYSDLQKFTYSDNVRPNLCEIVPSCDNSAGASFTITGDGFGTAQGGSEVPFTSLADSSVYFHPETPSGDWTDTSIQGTTNESMTPGDYWVTIYDGDTGLSSNGREYNFPCSAGPRVAELNSCDAEADVYPSPNPQPNEERACINAALGVLFDQQINTDTFNSDTVFLEQYNAGDTFNSAFSPLPVYGHFTNTEWSYLSGSTNYYGFQYAIDRTVQDSNQDGQTDGPGTDSSYLQPNTWYQLTLTTGITGTSGIAMESAYTMHFKTDNTTTPCAIESVNVSPSRSTIKNADGQSEVYSGNAYGPACALLDSSSYSWNWSIPSTDPADHTVAKFATGEDDHDPLMEIFVVGDDAENEGTATIQTAVDLETDDAEFIVDLGACTTNADCASCSDGSGNTSTCNTDTGHCTPVIKSFTPNSAIQGTWVTIQGCMFGSQKGNVYWNTLDGATSTETDWPNSATCGDTWDDSQIIVEMPLDLPTQDYKLQVETQYGDSTEAGTDYHIDQNFYPGICAISPEAGAEEDAVTIYGKALGDEEGLASFLGDDDYGTEADSGTRVAASEEATAWTPERVSTEVASGAVSGEDGFRAVTQGGDVDCAAASEYCSNSLEFSVSCSANNECGSGCCSGDGICQAAEFCNTCTTDEQCQESCGSDQATCSEEGVCTPVVTSIVQDSGPAGGPTTINGCFFGSYDSDASVTFGGEEAALYCTDGWSNTQIIANVPEALDTGQSYAVVVSNNGYNSNDDKTFSTTAQCSSGADVPDSGVPVLCKLSSVEGYAASAEGTQDGDSITFMGDQFGNPADGQSTGDLFTDEVVEGADPESTFDDTIDYISGDNYTYVGTGKSSATVPYGATSGPAVVSVNACLSNGLDFGTSCITADDCEEGYYCVDGVCDDDSSGECTEGTEDTVCGSDGECVVDDTGETYCAERPTFVSSDPVNGDTEVCPNREFSAVFSEPMTGFLATGDSATDTVRLNALDYEDGYSTDDFSEGIANDTVVAITVDSADGKTITVTPNDGWKTNTVYRLTFVSNTDTDTGIVSEANTLAVEQGTQEIYFMTAANECEPDHLVLINNDNGSSSEGDTATYTFTSSGAQTTFTVSMHTSDDQEIIPTNIMGWEYTWSPYKDDARCNNTAWVELGSDPNAETQTVTAGDENHAEDGITVTATPTTEADWSVDDVTANVNVFFCGEDNVWEYANTDESDDLRQNFDLLYCKDNGLPTLTEEPIITTDPDGDFFRQYLFVNPENEEQVVGIRVYPNTEDLTPDQWYAQNVPNPGEVSSLQVNGYEAVQDGLSYYVAASNVLDGTIYNNIYLFTFSDEETLLKIADQLINNVRFNMNLSHAECENSDQEKLIRDTKRVNDITTISNLANDFYAQHGYYPRPQSDTFGSYVKTMTTSVWPSWQGALGNLFGQTLPTDQYNIFYAADQADPWNAGSTPWVYEGEEHVQDCPSAPEDNAYYDQEGGTCWDTVNQHFFCPANSFTYMWKVDANNPDDSQTASIYAHLEYDGEGAYTDTTAIFDACEDISNAECSCYNYGITSQFDPGGTWYTITP
ncbi:MAG: Ig-like domain-containing protein [Candidatus Kerfeldbacteria bacterium]|nr:Ig-like domain-containing protein [Candidatus Kerfeldbacteria bacterium]